MLDFIKLIIGTIFFMCILFIIIVYGISKPVCIAKTKDIGMKSRWSFFGGCQIYDNNKWIPLLNYRYIEKKE